LVSQTQKTVLAGPATCANAAPTFRTLQAGDIPNLPATQITSGQLAVPQGGTGLGTLTAHAVLLGEGTANLGLATIGTAGRVLLDQGATADPNFQPISGDLTLAPTGAATIAAGAITLAKQSPLAASSLMGNSTGSAATPAPITLGANLSFSGSTLVASGGGGGLAIGGTVTGGTAGRVLFEAAGPVLADSANLMFNGTSLLVGATTLGFFGSAAVAQPTGDVGTALSSLGLVSSPLVGPTFGATVSGPGDGRNRFLYKDVNSHLAYSDNAQFDGNNVVINNNITTNTLTVTTTGNIINNCIQFQPGPLSRGGWIDLATSGSSGIGSGGSGVNPWIAYVSSNGDWFSGEAIIGDIAYRNTSGRLLFGTSSSGSTMRIAPGTSTTPPVTMNGGLRSALAGPYNPQTGAYTALSTDRIIACSAASGGWALTLPGASTMLAGFELTILKTDSNVNAITVTASGADKIAGVSTYALSAQYKYVHLVCDGSANWYNIGSN
jgi:hypothetical protein